MSTDISQVVMLYAKVLGSTHVITNTTRLRQAETATFQTTQSILGILEPCDKKEIQQVVRIAREHKTTLYPISTGKNWGYGSRIPMENNSFLLDLSRMNRITDYDEDLGYVTVEPGVTQKQLYEFLQKKQSSFSLGVTGSAPDTSIIGNICERGVGLGPYSFRAHYVSTLEVVLPSGRCIHTGFGRFANAQAAHVYREGLGPSFIDSFMQSNLGIITKLTLLLAPKPIYSQFIDLDIPEEKDLTGYLNVIRMFNLFTNSKKEISLYNDLSFLSNKTQYPWRLTSETPLPTGIVMQLKKKYKIAFSWKGVIEVHGYTKQEVAAQISYFKSIAGKLDGVTTSPLYPTDTLDSQPKNIGNGIYWRMRTKPPKVKNPDLDGCGNIRISLAVPFTTKSIEEVTKIIRKAVSAYGYEPFMEIHCISARTVLVVTTLKFDRTVDGEDANALRCHDALLHAVMEQGYYPYRANIRAMSLIPKSTDDYDTFQRTIKRAIDPDNIFSPGRYEVN